MRSSNELVEQQELEYRERIVEATAKEAAISIAKRTPQSEAISSAIEKTLGQQEAIRKGEAQDDGTFFDRALEPQGSAGNSKQEWTIAQKIVEDVDSQLL